MYKKIICSLLSIVFLITVHGNLVFANELSLPHPGDQSALENLQPREDLRSDETLRKLNQIKDAITDRFIIKLNESSSKSLKSLIINAYDTAKDAKDQAIATVLETREVTIKSVYSEDPERNPDNERLKDVLTEMDANATGTLLNQRFSEVEAQLSALQEDKQVISLPEKVDPEVFVREIQENLINEVEYIQPDYQVELAANEDESISLEVIPIGPGGKLEEIELPPSAQPSQEPDKAEEPTAIPEVTASPSAEPIKPEETPEPSETPIPSAEPEEPAADETVNPEPTTVPDSVIVAVIDTGIDVTHPDLEAHVVDGYNFVADNNQVYDAGLGMEQAHGTHVAGIIAQTAPDAQIMPLKCFENGRAYTSDLIEAIDYAKANGASIVNCSWGSMDNNQALKEAMENSGLFFVCSAGNNRMNVDETPIYPASFGLENTISVTALNQDYGFSYFSNYGTSSIDIAAIGREVESCFPGGERGIMNGTSMSAGFVSGAAAIARASGETELKTRIIATGDRLSNLQNKLKDGRALNVAHLISNTQSDEILDCNPADDFDVHGYQPTPEENWELFSKVETVQVAAGGYYSLALKSDGSVWSWGKNDCGQLGDNRTSEISGVPTQVPGLVNIKKISAGYDHVLALRDNGDLYAWGDNDCGQIGIGRYGKEKIIPVCIMSSIKTMAAGSDYSIAVDNEGRIYSWGLNCDSQLGFSTMDFHIVVPTLVDGIADVKEVTAGVRHTLAVTEKGTLYGWGYNYDFQLDESGKECSRPHLFTTISNVKSVAAGFEHTIALTEDGNVYTWGSNYYGRSDDAPGLNIIKTPTLVEGIEQIESISAGFGTSAAVKVDGTVYLWGKGPIGDGTTEDRVIPTRLPNVTNGKMVSSGETHFMMMTNTGIVYTWGSNNEAQLGDGAIAKSTIPILIPNFHNIEKVYASTVGKTWAIMDNGDLYAWGFNWRGDLGDGTIISRTSPTKILDNVASVESKEGTTIALKKDGTVYSWGKNNVGQLGNGTTVDNISPCKVEGLSDIIAVATDGWFTIALKEDGTVYTWGHNFYGQLGDGTTTNKTIPIKIENLSDIVAVDAGSSFGIALDKYGVAYSWGDNVYGELGIGTTTSQSVPTQIQHVGKWDEIVAEETHTFALDDKGYLYGWGYNYGGVLGNEADRITKFPTALWGIGTVKMVKTELGFTVALTEDGTIYTWGENDYGQLGDGQTIARSEPQKIEGLNEIIEIETSPNSVIALKNDGTIYFWGSEQMILTPMIIDGLNNVKTIAANNAFYAIQENGNIYAWGDNYEGLFGDGHMVQALQPYCLSRPVNPEPGDMENPIFVNLGQQVTGILTESIRENWYVYQSVEPGSYLFSKDGEVSMELYNSDGTQIITSNLTDGQMLNLSNTNTYLIKVSGETGHYSFSIDKEWAIIADEQYNTPDNPAYHANQTKLESMGWKEGYYFGKGQFSAESGKLIIKKTSPQESGSQLIYDVSKNFTSRKDNWNENPRLSVWTQNFKGDYEIKLKSSFNQPSSQVYYDILGGDNAGNDAVLGRYRVDPGTNGDFSVYNGNLNKPGVTTYPLWKNPQQSRTISTVTNFADATFQTFVDGSETPSKTTVDGADPDDTFSMTDWSKRSGSTYIKGIRFSAQTQAPVNSEIARIDSLQFIEHRAEHDIVDDAISVMDMSIVTDTPDAVVSNLKELPAELAGTIVTWTSSHPNIISNTGEFIAKPAFATDVTMTAKITNPADQYTKYMDFKLTVPVQEGFEETYTETFTGTPSSAGADGTKTFTQLPMWEFSYPGISNGTNGEVHTAQVLEKDNYLIFKKIADRQTANYQECLVGLRSLSNTEMNPRFSAAAVGFTAKVDGTGTMRFAPVTTEGNPVCTVILDASTKHIEIVYGEEQNGELVKVTQRIDSIDPTVDHDYALDLKEDNTFSFYVDGALKLTDQNALSRKYQPEAGENPVLSKLKTWITNITYANTEVGNMKRLSVYNTQAKAEAGAETVLPAIEGTEYMLYISGHNVKEFNKTYVVTYDQSMLEAVDLIGQSYQKETEVNTAFDGIHIVAYIPGRIEIKMDPKTTEGLSYSGFINAVKFKSLSTGTSTINLSN